MNSWVPARRLSLRHSRFSSPKLIYAGPLDFVTIHSYDLTPAEDRFIVHTPDPGGDITVLLNWSEELKRLVPTR